jgi:prophage regulatory protein
METVMVDTFLRIRDVIRVTGLPRSTLYDLIAKGLFPKSIPLGPRVVGWLEPEIAEWQRQRIEARDEQEAQGNRKAA